MNYHLKSALNFISVLILLGSLFFFFLLSSCASTQQAVRIGVYRFEHEGEKYRIRSISCENKSQSCNELAGKKFYARDILYYFW